MTTHQTPPPDCQVIDFRPECNVPSTAQVQVPAASPAQVLAHPVAGQVPAGTPAPAQQHAPIEHFMPPSDWHQPSWHLAVPSVHHVMELALTGGEGGLLAFAAAVGLIRHARGTGLEPREVGAAAAGAWTMPVGAMVLDDSWKAPLHLLAEAGQAAGLGGGYLVGALAAASITAIPAGWTAAALWWSHRREIERDGRAGSPKRSIRLQRRHEAAKARAGRKAARTRLPYVAGFPVSTQVVLGVCSQRANPTPDTMWSSLFSRHERRLMVPMSALNLHMFVIGDTGSGKTTMLFRLAGGAFYADWERFLAGGDRPLTIFLDGGGDIETGKRFVEQFARMGVQPDRVALFPTQASLDLWSMKPEEVTEILQKMVCPVAPDDAAQEFFFKSRRRVIRLAMGTCDHVGPAVVAPKSRYELFSRLTTDGLKKLYPRDKEIRDEIDGMTKTKPPMVSSVLGILRDVWDSLGPSIDTGKSLGDYDALYIAVPGTKQKDTARAQAAALIAMILNYAATPGHGRRIRLICDELSAINDDGNDIGIIEILERARKYFLSCVVAAQNTKGIGADEDNSARIMVSASGGAILMRGRGQGDACELFGTTPKSEATRHTLGGGHGDEGSTGIGESFLVHPDQLDEFEAGDAVFVNRRVASFGHVTPVDMAELPAIEQNEKTLLPRVEPRARTLFPVPDRADDLVDLDGLDDTPDLGEETG